MNDFSTPPLMVEKPYTHHGPHTLILVRLKKRSLHNTGVWKVRWLVFANLQELITQKKSMEA